MHLRARNERVLFAASIRNDRIASPQMLLSVTVASHEMLQVKVQVTVADPALGMALRWPGSPLQCLSNGQTLFGGAIGSPVAWLGR